MCLFLQSEFLDLLDLVGTKLLNFFFLSFLIGHGEHLPLLPVLSISHLLGRVLVLELSGVAGPVVGGVPLGLVLGVELLDRAGLFEG